MALWLQIALWVLGGSIALAVLVAACRTGKPLRRITASGVQGLCAMGLVDVLGAFTGVSLGFSWFTTGVCAALGIPGVICLLLLRILLPPV